jgi:hypothetical protein
MPGSAKQRKIDELMAKASESLVRTAYFETERMAEKALLMARQDQDYERMARIVLPLQEARRQRLQLALDTGRITLLGTPITEDIRIERGCYLVQPPNVGADARRLRLAAFNHEIPVAVLCREPLTQARLVPVVALGPGSTIRAKVRPPKSTEHPDLPWFIESMEALGDFAIETMDSTLPATKRIEILIDALDAFPEHENLHQALEAACRDAQRQQAADKTDAAAKAAAKTAKIKS